MSIHKTDDHKHQISILLLYLLNNALLSIPLNREVPYPITESI